MSDELVMAAATALATSGAALLVADSRSALAALVRLVRSRFGRGTPESEVLEEAVDDPDDHERTADLAEALAEAMADDPVFREQVRSYLRDVQAERSADHGAAVNQFNGNAAKVIQARDIRGGVTF